MGGATNVDRRKLEALVRFIVARRGRKWIGRIELVKLVFLMDYECFRRHGSTLTRLEYVQHPLGPLAWEIVATAQEMPDVAERSFTTLKGHRAYSYYLTDHPAAEALDGLSEAERRVAEHVFAEWGDEWWEAILEHVHSLPFVEQFECGEQVDWSAFVEEEDLVMTEEARERARARLEAVREKAGQQGAPDDESPHGWTDEGAAEMSENAQLARYSLGRLAADS